MADSPQSSPIPTDDELGAAFSAALTAVEALRRSAEDESEIVQRGVKVLIDALGLLRHVIDFDDVDRKLRAL